MKSAAGVKSESIYFHDIQDAVDILLEEVHEGLGWIEMHLECTRTHCVHIKGHTYTFRSGETIHTENSYKYAVDEFHALAAQAGFVPLHVWTELGALFGIHYLVAG